MEEGNEEEKRKEKDHKELNNRLETLPEEEKVGCSAEEEAACPPKNDIIEPQKLLGEITW